MTAAPTLRPGRRRTVSSSTDRHQQALAALASAADLYGPAAVAQLHRAGDRIVVTVHSREVGFLDAGEHGDLADILDRYADEHIPGRCSYEISDGGYGFPTELTVLADPVATADAVPVTVTVDSDDVDGSDRVVLLNRTRFRFPVLVVLVCVLLGTLAAKPQLSAWVEQALRSIVG